MSERSCNFPVDSAIVLNSPIDVEAGVGLYGLIWQLRKSYCRSTPWQRSEGIRHVLNTLEEEAMERGILPYIPMRRDREYRFNDLALTRDGKKDMDPNFLDRYIERLESGGSYMLYKGVKLIPEELRLLILGRNELSGTKVVDKSERLKRALLHFPKTVATIMGYQGKLG